MPKKSIFLKILILVASTYSYSQHMDLLRSKIDSVLSTKDAVVGIAIKGANTADTLSINGERHFPMQSVFKFHIALTVLSEVDKNKLALDQKIRIKKSELQPGLWSPIREKYPDGITLTLAEILEYTIALSDNVGCDVLLKLLGKPQTVEHYISSLGFKNFAVKINEETMQGNWDLQFLNWTTPDESNKILTAFYDNNTGLLSESSYGFLWQIMKRTKTGRHRLRGQLPEKTIVAHKTGWSGKQKKTGITAAVNDIGIIFLPNKGDITISVFITDSKEDLKTNEKIISDIAKLSWDHFMNL